MSKLEKFDFDGEIELDVDDDECIYLPTTINFGMAQKRDAPHIKVFVRVILVDGRKNA